jgi:ABC-type multidrug transport system fused ATPase/permease subunit
MPDVSFVKDELLAKPEGLLKLNWRLFRSLRVFIGLLPLTMLVILISSAAPSFYRWYSGSFANDAMPAPIPFLGIDLDFTLAGLFLITALAMSLRIAAWALFEISGMWSSQGIHSEMVEGMSRTRTTFFDENPSGRLINRLIRDYDEVRSTAIIFMGDFFNATVEILSIAVVTSFASPWAAVMTLPLLAGFSYVQFHRSGMLDHARGLSAIATGQVMGRKNDLIEGREIFLLYGRAEHLLRRISRSFRSYVQAAALTVHIDIWASFWIRIFAESFYLVVLLQIKFARYRGDISPKHARVFI